MRIETEKGAGNRTAHSNPGRRRRSRRCGTLRHETERHGTEQNGTERHATRHSGARSLEGAGADVFGSVNSARARLLSLSRPRARTGGPVSNSFSAAAATRPIENQSLLTSAFASVALSTRFIPCLTISLHRVKYVGKMQEKCARAYVDYYIYLHIFRDMLWVNVSIFIFEWESLVEIWKSCLINLVYRV